MGFILLSIIKDKSSKFKFKKTNKVLIPITQHNESIINKKYFFQKSNGKKDKKYKASY